MNDIPELSITLPLERKTRSPEVDALQHFNRQGWDGVYDEGELLFLLLKASCFIQLPKSAYLVCTGPNRDRNPFGVYHRRITEQLRLKPTSRYGVFRKWGDASERLEDIRRIKLDEVLTNSRLIRNNIYCRDRNLEYYLYYERYSDDDVANAFEALGNDVLAGIFEILTKKYRYTVRLDVGWPDLMLWRDGKAVFREVKTKHDRMQKAQRDVFNVVFYSLSLDYKVVRLLYE